MIFQPHEYQQRGIRFILDNPRCGLWWEPGTGKTPTTTMACAELINTLEAHRVLIVAPKRVALATWPNELAKWEQTQRLRVSVIMGTPKARLRALEDQHLEQAPIVVLGHAPFGVVIGDVERIGPAPVAAPVAIIQMHCFTER